MFTRRNFMQAAAATVGLAAMPGTAAATTVSPNRFVSRVDADPFVIFYDPTDGSDVMGDGSAHKPYRTLRHALHELDRREAAQDA